MKSRWRFSSCLNPEYSPPQILPVVAQHPPDWSRKPSVQTFVQYRPTTPSAYRQYITTPVHLTHVPSSPTLTISSCVPCHSVHCPSAVYLPFLLQIVHLPSQDIRRAIRFCQSLQHFQVPPNTHRPPPADGFGQGIPCQIEPAAVPYPSALTPGEDKISGFL